MQRYRLYRGFIAALFAASALAACGGGGGSTLPHTSVSPTPTPTVAPQQLPSPAAQSNSSSVTPSANASTTATLPATGGITTTITVPKLTAGSGSLDITVATGADATMPRAAAARHTMAMAGGPYLMQVDFVPAQTITLSAVPGFSLDVTQYVTGAGFTVAQAAAVLQGENVYAGISDGAGNFNVAGPLSVTATGTTLTVSYTGPAVALTLQAKQHYTIGIHLGPITAATSAPTASPSPTPTPTASPTASPTPTASPGGPSLVAQYTIPTANSGAQMLAQGPNDEIWFTETAAQKVAKVTTGGTFTEYAVPSANPGQIIAGPDGNMWFDENPLNGNVYQAKIASISESGTVTEHAVVCPTGYGDESWVEGITVGPDGNIWFTLVCQTQGTASYTTVIGSMTTSGSFPVMSVQAQQPLSSLGNITSGPDGRLWFADTANDRIGASDTSGNVTYYGLHSGASPSNIANGPNGNLWFVESDAIAEVSTGGLVNEYRLSYQPGALVCGLDGNIWFTGDAAHPLNSMTTGGKVTTYTWPSGFSPWGNLVSGPNNNIWAVDNKNAIDEIAP